MKLSTRNQVPGTVVSLTLGEAMAVVKIRIEGSTILTSSITREAATDLGLAEGAAVTALIKANDIALGVDD